MIQLPLSITTTTPTRQGTNPLGVISVQCPQHHLSLLILGTGYQNWVHLGFWKERKGKNEIETQRKRESVHAYVVLCMCAQYVYIIVRVCVLCVSMVCL